MRRIPMHMQDWIKKLEGFLTLNNRNILDHVGKVFHEMAMQLADDEYEKFHKKRLQLEAEQSDKNNFDDLARQISEQGEYRKK